MRIERFRLAASCALALAAITMVVPPAQAQPSGRNILFIAVDDLRNWVNYAGDYAGTVHTPNIDTLAAVSTRYLNAYTPMPQCVAARTSVMFGQRPSTHGLDRVSFGPGDPRYDVIYSNPELLTLPEVMAAGGYFTAVTGKVFNSPLPERWNTSGPAINFSEFHNAFDPGPDNTFLNPQVLDASEEHPDQVTADWAVDFIANYPGSQAALLEQPFFLAVGFYQPHIPWRVHQSFYDLYPLAEVVVSEAVAGDLEDLPSTGVNHADQPILFSMTQHQVVEAAGKAREYTQAYLASISHTDAMVGQVLQALSLSPYADSTDIILWSDNGFHLGEKFHWRKLTFWEQAVKVPLLVSAPGNPNYPAGDVTDPVSLVDLAPTVLDLAGLPDFPQFEGAPLYDADNRSPAEVFLDGGMALISGATKVIDYNRTSPAANNRETYNLLVDPVELVNLTPPPPGC